MLGVQLLYLAVIQLLASQVSSQIQETMMCNSSPDLCKLRYNQVTFAGSHNSGSGFDGSLTSCDGTLQNDCVWRSQNLDITGQLNLGIRFLEIDLCLFDSSCNSAPYGDIGNSRLFTCYAILDDFRYAGPVSKIFQQVDDWLVANPNEVIGLYFSPEFPTGEENEIISELITLLESKWFSEENVIKSVYMNTWFNNSIGEWPTLEQAISINHRIFVFIDPLLTENSENATNLAWNNPALFSTYEEPSQVSNTCEDLAKKCNETNDILVEAAVTRGVCIFNGQDNCNVILPRASYDCFDLRRAINKTVNVITVDFPERAVNLSDVVRVLNEWNIMNFSPTPLPTGIIMSSETILHSGLFCIFVSLVFALLFA